MSIYKDHEKHREQANYETGQADLCNEIIKILDEAPPKDITQWLQERRQQSRDRAIDYLEQAIKALEVET